ncbi:hypothetical protein GCM10028791_34960 [Echinicola sediminis]
MKKSIFITITIMTLYYLSLLFFGTAALSQKLGKDTNSTFFQYQWTSNIKVIGNFNVEEISKIFQKQNINISTVHSENNKEIIDSFFTQNSYNYMLLRNSKYLPLTVIQESEKMDEYAAVWEKKYLWCFAFWILIDDRMIGIS